MALTAEVSLHPDQQVTPNPSGQDRRMLGVGCHPCKKSRSWGRTALSCYVVLVLGLLGHSSATLRNSACAVLISGKSIFPPCATGIYRAMC